MTPIESFIQSINKNKYLSIAYKLTRNIDDANDLFQDTILKALTKQNCYIEQGNIDAWFYRILKNTYINNYRSIMRHPKVSLEYVKESTCIDNFFNKELVDQISKENKLGIDLIKQWGEGYSYKELSEMEQTCIGNIKSRIFIARQHLKAKYGEVWNY